MPPDSSALITAAAASLADSPGSFFISVAAFPSAWPVSSAPLLIASAVAFTASIEGGVNRCQTIASKP